MLLALTALQISALPRFVVDAVAFTEGELQDGCMAGDSDCDERTCPPGCPTCHHAHPEFLPAPVSPIRLEALVTSESSGLVFEFGRAPPKRFIAPLDRPPRASA